MQLVDWIAAGVVLVALMLGFLLGFGKLLKIFTGGILGIIISLVLTYFSIGVVASWGFVQELMGKLVSAMQNFQNGFVQFLLKISTEKILLAVILFFIIQLARILTVNIIKSIAEIDTPIISGINRISGAIFMVGVTIVLALLFFHIVDLIGGNTEENMRNYLHGFFRLDWVFNNNPLKYIIQKVMPA